MRAIRERYSMLIDAGASYHGYAADVTRTYSAKPGLFSDLIAAMNEAQLAIIDDIQVNLNYVELHTKMHYRLAQVLKDFALVDMSFDAMVESNLTFTFCPMDWDICSGYKPMMVAASNKTNLV